MTFPSESQLIAASFPAAYLIAYVATPIELRPTTFGDTIMAMFVSTYMSLCTFLYVWLGLAILSVPIFVIAAIFQQRR